MGRADWRTLELVWERRLQSLFIAGQTFRALSPNQPGDKELRDRQRDVIIAGLTGIGPRDALEGMIASQLLACHDAAMDCYRRAGVEKYGFRENLNLAGKLSRTYSMLLDALNRHRGKGQQKNAARAYGRDA